MQGGPSKINPPNSHPSNPIHKAAEAQSRKAQPKVKKIEPTVSLAEKTEPTPQHEINKTAVIIGAVGLALLLAWW